MCFTSAAKLLSVDWRTLVERDANADCFVAQELLSVIGSGDNAARLATLGELNRLLSCEQSVGEFFKEEAFPALISCLQPHFSPDVQGLASEALASLTHTFLRDLPSGDDRRAAATRIARLGAINAAAAAVASFLAASAAGATAR